MTTTQKQRKTPERKPRESLKTIAFDSAGDKKFALQIQKAANGNPCLRIVQGTPQQDGTYRKFDLVFWSEDWPAFFEALDDLRAHIDAEGICTPAGHKWSPSKQWNGGKSRTRAA